MKPETAADFTIGFFKAFLYVVLPAYLVYCITEWYNSMLVGIIFGYVMTTIATNRRILRRTDSNKLGKPS